MRLLVTGGAGFIGGHLAHAFVRDGHAVTVLDNFEPFYDLDLKERNVELARTAAGESDGTYELVRGDVRDEEVVEDVVSDADIVYHKAAQAGVRASVEMPKKVTDINVRGTLNVLEAARESATERIVIAGSSSAYGKPKNLPYDERHPTEPVSPYGVSKLASDHYARVYDEVFGLPTVVLRYFTVYGPRMRPNMAMSNFVSRCLNGESPVVYGDGSQTRDFTYVDDVIAANRTLLTSDAADGKLLNVGSGDNIDIDTLAREIRDQIDSSLSIEYDERQAGDAEHTHADVSKARETIGYEPTYTIRDGVEQFVAWYRENRDWYEPLVR